MNANKVMKRLELVPPTESNSYCVFSQILEEKSLVLFHATPKRHIEAIANSGFRSAHDLGLGELRSVSYAKRSSSCLAHIGRDVQEDYVIFAVEFGTLQQDGIVENFPDIHVYRSEIQPEILGYCEIPKGFHYS
jgi:hypothetical protein